MAETRGPYQRMSPESGENPQVTEQQQRQQQPERQKPRHKYKGILYNFGITEVVFGSISILLAIITLIIAATYKTYTTSYYYDRTRYRTYHYNHYLTHSSQGIWCGALLIVTGILGIKTKSRPSVCMFNANMALSIITACFMVVLISMSAIAASTPQSYYGGDRIQSLTAFHSILAILGLSAGIICIIHSAYCCAGVCCQRKAYQGPVTYVPQSPFGTNQPQQMVRLANGQYMLVPFQLMPGHSYTQTYPGPAVLPPHQADVAMPQTMPPQSAGMQPIIIYPGGPQQPLQPGSTMISQPPTAVTQTVPHTTKSQDPPGYIP